ncbi:hypothetical protein LI328DRAFT_15207 [Trichoderma asperelloides]|nr:hypothetical protein LI328DRAFT_15207 [Trichoderma asperelloides]
MTCRARRESFFWLRARQFFLSCLFSFSSFLSSPPTLSSSVPWFVSSLQSSAACLANRQSPIDNPGYPVFSLPTFSLSNRTKKVRAPVQSPPKSQVFGPPLGIFSPFASPRLASLLPIASGWSVTCLPHFSPTELPRLKTKPQRSPLTRPFFFFPDPFCLHPLHVSRLTQQVQTTRSQLVHFPLPSSNPNALHIRWKHDLRMHSTSVPVRLIGSWSSRALSEPAVLQMLNLVILR